jgi:ornithine carbamoyltransferase
MPVSLKGRSFLTLQDFSQEEIMHLLNLSKDLKDKKRAGIKGNALFRKNIVLIFDKTSTRTRCAFEVAAFDEGACVTYLSQSQMGKKESIEDTAKVLGRYYDGIEYRGFDQKLVEDLAKYSKVPVWNGLTDEDHPTQILADFLTIMEHVEKPLHKVKLVFVGDVKNNMGNALMTGCAKLGMHFVGLGPKEYFTDKAFLNKMQKIAKETGAKIELTDNIAQAVKGADVVYTDVWVSMGDEKELEIRVKKFKKYQVTMNMIKLTKNPQVKFMHCLPALHDLKTDQAQSIHKIFGLKEMEVTDEVFRSKHSIVFDEAENRMHTIKAVMVATIGDV